MPETLKKIYEKTVDMFFRVTKKFDGLSEMLYKQTGMKINVGAVILGTVLLIIVLAIAFSVLGGIKDFLFGN